MVSLDPDIFEQVVAVSHEAARPGEYRPLPDELDAGVREALASLGINRLYLHQADAWAQAAARRHAVITTPSASGKSLCYNLPVLDALARDDRKRALFLYPTKALTQDQVRKLQALKLPFVRPGVYDGDTPTDQRPAIRRRANIILTNPDMLHLGILPHRDTWEDFFFNLEYVVVDEAHTYRGVFGSHMANVLRRLRRVCRVYGSEPVFLLTTATIANPGELAESLTGLEFELVERDGSPRGERQIVFWNPPFIDEALGIRRSVFTEAAVLFADLVAQKTRTMAFARTRKGTELIYKYARERLEELRPELAGAVSPYRGGYTPAQRREIERSLFEGELYGVIATSALELGIDVGGIDAVISAAFPGTVASLRQQWGRAGREGSRSLAVFMAGQDALDQFFAAHPEELLERDVEEAIVDFQNEYIFAGHLGAAAYEAPLGPEDEELFGPSMMLNIESLKYEGKLRESNGRFIWAQPGFPAAGLNLRSTSADSFTIVIEDTGDVLGEVEAERAFVFIHPGAIYMHLGETYQVRRLDLEGRVALVRPVLADYYTQPKKETSIEIMDRVFLRTAAGVGLSFGRVIATEHVVAYQKKSLSENQVLEIVELDLPEQEFRTEGIWFPVGDEVLAGIEPPEVLGGLHALEHGLIALLPLFAMCDRWDIGGLSTEMHWQVGGPAIFIYDGHPGGIGITRRGFDRFEDVAARAGRMISSCRCESGCPSCIQSPKCGNLNEPLSKAAAALMLERMTGGFHEGQAAKRS
ncbi:MAG: DEAD/DEAH box helicase [Gaiellales bacterium]|nr:MAG: DEAD/DEAH box helicase [Gaiellales bacterium]